MGKCYLCKHEMTQKQADNDELDFNIDAPFSVIVHRKCKKKEKEKER